MNNIIKPIVILLIFFFTSCSYLKSQQSIEYHKNGTIKAMGHLKQSQRTETWVFYDEQGTQVDSISYKEGFKEGESKTYSLITEELVRKGKYKNDKKHGIWESYHDDGNVHSREEFKNGVPIGEYAYFFADGKPKILTPIYNGKWHGAHKEYYHTGKLSVTGYYHNGVRDGEWKEYYENDLIKEIYHCQSDLWHGNYEKYYPNGNIAEKGRYELDKKVGTWEYFDKNGIILSTRKY